MLLRSRAPTRIDFAGGYTDLIPFAVRRPGAVVNAAISLYTCVALQVSDELFHNRCVDVCAPDLNLHLRIPDVRKNSYDGKLDLVKAILCRMSTHDGLSLQIYSDAPPGGGLGSSGAMGVALVGILSEYMGKRLSSREIADIASEVERGIGVCCGKQDHYASVAGGINYMEFHGEMVELSRLELGTDVLRDLERSLCLCYTGKSRFARSMLQNVLDAYLDGNRETAAALASLRRIALEMKRSLLSGDLQSFGELLGENWENQRRLHPSISNSQINGLFDIACSSGAISGKACGAGGGGCLVFFCEPDKAHSVRMELIEAGAQVFDFDFDFGGLQVWAPTIETVTPGLRGHRAEVRHL